MTTEQFAARLRALGLPDALSVTMLRASDGNGLSVTFVRPLTDADALRLSRCGVTVLRDPDDGARCQLWRKLARR